MVVAAFTLVVVVLRRTGELGRDAAAHLCVETCVASSTSEINSLTHTASFFVSPVFLVYLKQVKSGLWQHCATPSQVKRERLPETSYIQRPFKIGQLSSHAPIFIHCLICVYSTTMPKSNADESL